jgi:hypothetical protein
MESENERVIDTTKKYCRHESKNGEKCALYLDHYGKHKSNHLKSEWDDSGI